MISDKQELTGYNIPIAKKYSTSLEETASLWEKAHTVQKTVVLHVKLMVNKDFSIDIADI